MRKQCRTTRSGPPSGENGFVHATDTGSRFESKTTVFIAGNRGKNFFTTKAFIFSREAK
jgi:hypothetical protein